MTHDSLTRPTTNSYLAQHSLYFEVLLIPQVLHASSTSSSSPSTTVAFTIFCHAQDLDDGNDAADATADVIMHQNTWGRGV
jgi:hypothetical protein